jgi:5-carboxymethyl-2-hydroxymuconate isomerase
VEMPHITIEYSQGANARVDINRLAQGVHIAARTSGIFPANAVRTFAREATISFVADEHPENVFVQIVARVAPGRPPELLKRVADLLFAAGAAEAAEALDAGRFALRVDLTESDPALSAYRNTLPT